MSMSEKRVDEGPYWCYYTHMKWEPSVSWGGAVVGDCGWGGEEDDRLFTATKRQHGEHRRTHEMTKQQIRSVDNEWMAK